jgi:toxin ParE1/3/4
VIARSYRVAIVARCHQLESFPDRGRSRDDLRQGLQTIVHRRRVTMAYEVEGERVVIVAIIGQGRDIAAALDA